MIHVQTIHIEEFRGIRRLKFKLEAKSSGVCGPDGPEKSGGVDVVDF